MKEWELSAELIRLGHTIKVTETGWRCVTCDETIHDILRLKVACVVAAAIRSASARSASVETSGALSLSSDDPEC